MTTTASPKSRFPKGNTGTVPNLSQNKANWNVECGPPWSLKPYKGTLLKESTETESPGAPVGPPAAKEQAAVPICTGRCMENERQPSQGARAQCLTAKPATNQLRRSPRQAGTEARPWFKRRTASRLLPGCVPAASRLRPGCVPLASRLRPGCVPAAMK